MKTLRLYRAGLLVALLLSLAAHGGGSPNFTLSLNPTSLTVQQGSSGTAQLTITPQNGFTGTVNLSLVGAPSGVTLTVNAPDSGLGTTWTTRILEGDSLYGVAYGSGTFVAVGRNGTILTSPDGRSWTARTSGTSNWIEGVSYGNNTFVALGENGTILTSP